MPAVRALIAGGKPGSFLMMSGGGPLRVLVVEDDDSIRGFIADGLEQAGHKAEPVAFGLEAIEMANARPFDAAIVDLMLPDSDGFQIVRELRERRLAAGILVLSAKDTVRDRVAGLTLGADDYLGKPFDMTELLARIDAVTRRSGAVSDAQHLQAGGVVLDLASRTVHREGCRIDLTQRELALLTHLMRTEGKPLSKSYLLQQLWHTGFDPGTNVVDVLVCRLRSKLEKGFPQRLIHTVRGVGYVFRAEAI
jgi:two-component system OmpR family response regulator